MLNIALYNNKINYIRSDRNRKGLSIISCGANQYDSLDTAINKSAVDIFNKDKIKSEKISYTIDSQFCVFNNIFCENENSLDFHNDLSGNGVLSNHMDSYYYPIGLRDDHYLGIHIDKSIKQRLQNATKNINSSFSSFSIGIFSAEILARYIFQAKGLDDYLILRFINSNLIEVLYIDDGILMLYGKYRVSRTNIKSIKSFGNMESKKKIENCLDKIIVKRNKSTSIIQKIFIYQSQGQSPIVKELIRNQKNTNLILLNLFNYTNSSAYNCTIKQVINDISYSELGHIFRGMHV